MYEHAVKLVLDSAQTESLDAFLTQVIGSTPLLFVREFLRTHKQHSKQVRIGTTRQEVTANLRDAIVSKRIGRHEVENWFHAVEGWGKQHLYLTTVRRHSLAHAHLLNTSALKGFLKKKGLLKEIGGGEEPGSVHIIDQVLVDDELARITWRSHALDHERREELDEVRELDDGQYEFRAYRRVHRKSTSQVIIRKTDGVVVVLVALPLGEEHTGVRDTMEAAAKAVLAPLLPEVISLSPVVSALDQGAVAAYGPKPQRALALGVAPTQARYRTDGARLEFTSTRSSSAYAESVPVRHVRRAMQIQNFEGEAGKFRLTFEGKLREAHDMIVSLHALENRIYLFSRMSETEVLALVDQLIQFGS